MLCIFRIVRLLSQKACTQRIMSVHGHLCRHARHTNARRLEGECCHGQQRPRGVIPLDVDAGLHLQSGQRRLRWEAKEGGMAAVSNALCLPQDSRSQFGEQRGFVPPESKQGPQWSCAKARLVTYAPGQTRTDRPARHLPITRHCTLENKCCGCTTRI